MGQSGLDLVKKLFKVSQSGLEWIKNKSEWLKCVKVGQSG